jgi:hypothetical protein
MPAEGGNIPATVDVWLAEDGGYLLRTIISSHVGASRTAVSRVNDPTLTIEAPMP